MLRLRSLSLQVVAGALFFVTSHRSTRPQLCRKLVLAPLQYRRSRAGPLTVHQMRPQSGIDLRHRTRAASAGGGVVDEHVGHGTQSAVIDGDARGTKRGRVIVALVAQRIEARRHHQGKRQTGQVVGEPQGKPGVGRFRPEPLRYLSMNQFMSLW